MEQSINETTVSRNTDRVRQATTWLQEQCANSTKMCSARLVENSSLASHPRCGARQVLHSQYVHQTIEQLASKERPQHPRLLDPVAQAAQAEETFQKFGGNLHVTLSDQPPRTLAVWVNGSTDNRTRDTALALLCWTQQC